MLSCSERFLNIAGKGLSRKDEDYLVEEEVVTCARLSHPIVLKKSVQLFLLGFYFS